MASELSEYLNSINYTKEDLMDGERGDCEKWKAGYVPFVVNHCLMPHPDAIFWANELNRRPFMDKDQQYRFLLNILPKKKRFAKWLKHEKDEENLELVKQFYGYSTRKAKDVLPLLTDEDIDIMKAALVTGGRK